jgi:hypothetical protein
MHRLLQNLDTRFQNLAMHTQDLVRQIREQEALLRDFGGQALCGCIF